ncbi:MAG: hypothetical protein VYB65_04695 [Myxococcota bacterium]|nr:hypothetical protein [Myxococcota bacterium]
MRALSLLIAAALCLPATAQASRYKSYGGGQTSVSTARQNAFLRPSPYSRGGAAKTSLSFTTSPLWALVGLAKVKGEVAVLDRLSVALQAAGGYSVPHDAPTLGLGAQVSLYWLGNFDRGWSIGGNVMQFGSMLDPAGLAGASWERFEGLFIGWKSTAADRNVLEVQFGAQRWRHADSSPLDAQAPSLVPTLGLNYGWAW